jgi:hypothetical protein
MINIAHTKGRDGKHIRNAHNNVMGSKTDSLCGLVVRVTGYSPSRPGFDS